ncbi:MAG: hypothetical protein GKR94_31525 [Gammaproteobacteria bacterium]|nr:hypothetical protein [Gammaproteobacteria bacterium]
MTREIITIGVGGAGIRAATKFWELILAEHGIGRYGTNPSTHDDGTFECFFEKTGAGQFVPRSLLVDLEPNVINDVKNSQYAAIFHPDFLLSGREDAGNNFARGYYTVGKEIIDKVNDRVRKLVDSCDNVQGFIIFHALGGGTGSGLGALLLERLAVDYREKSKIAFAIYPSPTMSHCVVEPYNALLSTHWLLKYTDVSFIFDNEALVEYCQKWLDIEKPTYDHLNELIAHAASGITASLRFEEEFNVDLDEFKTNLVPYSRLHLMTVSLAGFTTKEKSETENQDVQNLSENLFSPSHFLTKIVDFDIEEDKYMAISLTYRGGVKAKVANAMVQWLKTNRKVTFVEEVSTGFKIGLSEMLPTPPTNWTIYPLNITGLMIGNNTAINRALFNQRISKKYDLMYSQRAFVHWYISEGMEEGKFAEAREDLGLLEKDYLDVLTSDYEDEEENENDD